MERELGEKLPVNWRYFSLEQHNEYQDYAKNVWDGDTGIETRGINAFRAAEAVRRQGDRLFEVFHGLLLDARHRKNLDISDPDVLTGTAVKAGAEKSRFLTDYSDDGILNRLAEDHRYAVNELNIFGTPTFVFDNCSPVFLKIESPDLGENLEFFREFIHIAGDRPGVLEIKRP